MKDDLVEQCTAAAKAIPIMDRTCNLDQADAIEIANAVLKIARPAIRKEALEEAAKVAEGQPYKDYHRPDGSPIYRTCSYTTPDGNWATQRHHTNQYGNARADAAAAIRALAHTTGQEGGR